MSATHSIEWNCEDLILKKLQAEASFAGQDIRHWDGSAKAIIEAIIIRAEKGEKQLEGNHCWEVKVSVLFASGKLTADQADAVAMTIGQTIYKVDSVFNATIHTILPDLDFLSIEPETATMREDTKKLRKRTMVVPMLAKLIN